MRRVRMEVTDRGAVYIDGTRVTGRATKWGVHTTILKRFVRADRVTQNLRKNGFGHIELDATYAKEQGVS